MSRAGRRDFLRQSLLAATAVALSPLDSLFARPRFQTVRGASKKIIVAGAGLAGLVAAYELRQAGHDVRVIEARSRPGGRVFTLREPFADGLYAEGGATRIPINHDLTLKYAERFGLQLLPFYPDSGHFISFDRGQRREADWERFTEDTRAIGLGKRADWLKIQGGNDLLPAAFARRLEGAIIYDAPVVRIEQDARGVTVAFKRRGTQEKLAGDYLVCAIPFSTLRNVSVSPAFSHAKQKVIAELEHDSASRVFLQVRSRFWKGRDGANGYAIADHMIEIWDSTLTQPGTRGVLQTYLRGSDSEKLTAMAENERVKVTLERMEQVFPGTRANFEKGVSKCWSEDEWALGAWVHPDEEALPLIMKPEGRVYFAGDHTSARPSWMQGALESGLRAVKEISRAAQGITAQAPTAS